MRMTRSCVRSTVSSMMQLCFRLRARASAAAVLRRFPCGRPQRLRPPPPTKRAAFKTYIQTGAGYTLPARIGDFCPAEIGCFLPAQNGDFLPALTLPDSVAISFAGIISFDSNEKKPFITKIQEDFKSFVPILSTRMDMKHLYERVGQVPVDLPSVLLLGCSSVGSYLLPELVNMGFTHIGVSDPDTFVSGNSLRHYLGPRSSGSKKAVQMQFFMEYENPLVSIDVVPDILEQKENELAKTLEKYQIVIVAVGSTDIQRKLNYMFSKANSKAWHIFNWLDAEGKGSHVLAMRYSQKGCFDCLFRDKGEFTTKNKVTYADGTERVIGNGCGGSFSPYGNNVLARNTVLALSVLQAILDGSITRNTIASIRNEFTSLVSSISMTPVIDEDFAEEGCDICGNI